MVEYDFGGPDSIFAHDSSDKISPKDVGVLRLIFFSYVTSGEYFYAPAE